MRQPRWIVLGLFFAGVVDMWTVAVARDLIVQIIAGFVAATCLVSAGIVWERRYTFDLMRYVMLAPTQTVTNDDKS